MKQIMYPKYRITKDGRVWSDKHNKYLRLHDNGTGYLFVRLSNKNIAKNLYVHRLVAMAYIPNNDNFPEVNHIDGDKTNNNASNLEWCTRNMNTRHKLGDINYKKYTEQNKPKSERLESLINNGVHEDFAKYALSI